MKSCGQWGQVCSPVLSCLWRGGKGKSGCISVCERENVLFSGLFDRANGGVDVGEGVCELVDAVELGFLDLFLNTGSESNGYEFFGLGVLYPVDRASSGSSEHDKL